MHDHAEKWPAIPDWAVASLVGDGLTVTSLSGLRQVLVSGNLQAWNEASGQTGPGTGALGLAETDSYQVRLARDRLLAIDSQISIAPGWHEAGFAVTDMSAALHVFECRGPGIAGLIARATTLDPANPGPSASASFAGIVASLYYHRSKDVLRVHVDRGFATHIWTWLQAQPMFTV